MHLRMDNGDDVEVALQNPIAMLDTVARDSTYFSDLLAATYERQPCTKETPWTIVLYLSAYVGGPPTRLRGERRSHHAQPPPPLPTNTYSELCVRHAFLPRRRGPRPKTASTPATPSARCTAASRASSTGRY